MFSKKELRKICNASGLNAQVIELSAHLNWSEWSFELIWVLEGLIEMSFSSAWAEFSFKLRWVIESQMDLNAHLNWAECTFKLSRVLVWIDLSSHLNWDEWSRADPRRTRYCAKWAIDVPHSSVVVDRVDPLAVVGKYSYYKPSVVV